MDAFGINAAWIGRGRPETEALRHAMISAGIRVQVADTVESAEAMAEEDAPDVAVIDTDALVAVHRRSGGNGSRHSIPLIRIGSRFHLNDPEGGADVVVPPDRPAELVAMVRLLGGCARRQRLPATGAVGDVTTAENDQLQKDLAEATRLAVEAATSESRWRRILDHSPAAICVIQGRRMVYWNRAADRLLDLSGAAGQRRQFVQMLMEPAQIARWGDITAQGDTPGAAARTELTVADIDGADRILAVDLMPVDFRGESSWLLLIVDVTQGRHETNAMAQREAEYRALFDHSPVPMIIQNFTEALDMMQSLSCAPAEYAAYLHGHPEMVDALARCVRFSRMNAAARELFSTASHSNALSSMDQVLVDQDRDHFIDQMVAFAGGALQYDGTARNRVEDGRICHLVIRKVALPDRADGYSRVLASFLDVTEQVRNTIEIKALEKQLRQTQKMEALGTLASGIAHDFNNVLTPILGHAELMMAQIPEDSPFRRNLDEICTSADRARCLVRQILSFSRRTEFAIAPLAVGPIVEEVGHLIRSSLPRSVAVEFAIAEPCGRIMADPTHLHQVVMNLATNAYHAMQGTGGTLTLGLREVILPAGPGAATHLKPGTYVCLSVADTGQGMDAATVEHIFTPYFTTKTKDEGTGLGLAVVHNIVKSYQGEIVVQSMPGRGTAVEVYFPKMAEASSQEPLDASDLVSGGREDILVVDDEESIVSIIEQVLTRYGYHAHPYGDGVSALDAFTADPDRYGILITDYSMPRMTGDQLARRMKIIRPDLPVILLTGYGTPILEDVDAFPEIDQILVKPVFARELASVVRELLDRGAQSAQAARPLQAE